MGDNKDKIEKPKPEEKKLKPSERIKYNFREFDWPTERENYKRLCRDEKILTYEVYTYSLLYLYIWTGVQCIT